MKRIKGIGPKKQERLERLGIFTPTDLVYDFPRRYIDRCHVSEICFSLPDEEIVVRGEVLKKSSRVNRLYLTVATGLAHLRVLYFHSAFLESKFEIGREYYFFGRVQNSTMFNPEFGDVIGEGDRFLRILPVYRLTEGYGQNEARKFHERALTLMEEDTALPENLPRFALEEENLPGRKEALRQLHLPDSFESIEIARRRIRLEELFRLQFRLYYANRRPPCEPIDAAAEPMIRRLPFKLTDSQRSVVREILADLKSGRVMNRMVQGDVGSGKSVVAFLAMRLVSEDHQALMMAPTRLLAEQLHRGYVGMFGGGQTALLHSGLPKGERRAILSGLLDGTIRALFGTHAVIHDAVRFSDLRLVVTDEQQRFGVVQQELAQYKAGVPHRLYLTATPIPRMLALSMLGVTALSRITQLPKGRVPVVTKIVPNEDAERMIAFIDRKIGAGDQAYFVVPSITEGRVTLEKVYDRLKKRFPNRRIAYVHGEMKDRIHDVMESFRAGQIDILVATTVIEVGIDVPNATIMVIMESDRFGLSQLHQLRGRVGRGGKQSFCFLMSRREEVDRLEILSRSSDGFEIAERDLAQRGPGSFFGVDQHGRLPISFPFTSEDLETARRWVEKLEKRRRTGDQESSEYVERQKEEWIADHRRLP